MSEYASLAAIIVAGIGGIVALTWRYVSFLAYQSKRYERRASSSKHAPVEIRTPPRIRPPFLCRMIGHRWTAAKLYRLGDMRAVETQVFGCCTRCGEPTPEGLTGRWHECDPTTPDKDPLDLARGWDLREGKPGTP